jgi:hypothetical protein
MSSTILPKIQRSEARRAYELAWRAYRVALYSVIGVMSITHFGSRHHAIHHEVSRSYGVSPDMARLMWEAEERDHLERLDRSRRARAFDKAVEDYKTKCILRKLLT